MHLMGVYLTGLYLTGMHLMSVHLKSMHLICVHLTGVYLMNIHINYESSLRAGHGWRESLYRPQGCFQASDCGRLGRQAADHPWSALHVVKSCRKTAQRPRCCSKLKQQLCIQNGTRAHYLNYLQRGRVRRGKKRRQSDWLANQIDRKVIDGQVIDRKTDK